MPSVQAYALILLLTLLPGFALAGKESLSPLESKVVEQQRRLNQVKKAMEEKRDLLRDSTSREANLLGQLEELDQALGNGRGQLAKLTREAAEKTAEIQRKNEELAILANAKESSREHVKQRLAAIYRLGEVGILNAIFSSNDFTDLLNLKESIRILLAQDQKSLGDYHRQVAALTKLRDELQKENLHLQQVISTSEQQTQRLADSHSQRLKLLNSIGMEKRLYQQALEEMAGAAGNLNRTMAQLRDKLAASQKTPAEKQSPGTSKPVSPGGGFAALKGRLPPPVRGAVTTYFGKSAPGKFGIATSSEGIDIKTMAGAEITAVGKGKVAYVGPLRGYGNLLILDHGQQYYSLMARATEFYKKVGETVNTGEVLGVMSNDGGLLGEGLHFEIRKGTTPENPLDWLNRSLLKTVPEAGSSRPDRKDYNNN